MVRISQARLADLQTGKRSPEIDVTRAQLMQTLAEKKKSIDILKSYESQYAAGGVSLTDLIAARAAVETNTALVRQVESELVVAALPARDEQLKAQAEQWRPIVPRWSRPRGSCSKRRSFRRATGWYLTHSTAKENGLRPATRWCKSFPPRIWKSASLCPSLWWASSSWSKAS